MEEGKAKFENKSLVILLCVLIVAIVGLGIGIGVVMLNSKEEVAVEDKSTEEEGIVSTATLEQIETYEAFRQEYDAVLAETQRLLSENPVDTVAIRELYTEAMSGYMNAATYGNVQDLMIAEYDSLISGGFKEEALDALVSVDFSIFPESVQNRWYNKIVDLAQELGNVDLVAKYQQLADMTKEAAVQSEAAIREYASEYDVDAEFTQGGA